MDVRGLVWRKSSRSGGSGNNDNCVEIAFAWRKSSRSGGSGTNDNCVEIAFTAPTVAIRDSKNPAAGILTFPTTAFTTLCHKQDW